MNHDVISDRYARLFELPQQLNLMGDVVAVCLSYRLHRDQPIPQGLLPTWRRLNLPRSLLIGWIFQLMGMARELRPGVVVASSDCLCVIVGAWLAKIVGAQFYADLYDEYDTFGLARIPGMRWLYRRALQAADGIIAVSETLAEDLREQYPGKPVMLLESTIDSSVFYPRPVEESREHLGLQRFAGRKLVGLCGGLNRFHGADVSFQAIRDLAARREDVVFVLAGRAFPECPLPEGENVVFLGMLPHADMPWFYSAMDVVMVPLSDTRFGYYAFPQKAYEVLACRRPVAAANVGALGRLFEALPSARYQPNSPDDLLQIIEGQLEHPAILEVDILTWADQAARLAKFTGLEKGVD